MSSNLSILCILAFCLNAIGVFGLNVGSDLSGTPKLSWQQTRNFTAYAQIVDVDISTDFNKGLFVGMPSNANYAPRLAFFGINPTFGIEAYNDLQSTQFSPSLLQVDWQRGYLYVGGEDSFPNAMLVQYASVYNWTNVIQSRTAPNGIRNGIPDWQTNTAYYLTTFSHRILKVDLGSMQITGISNRMIGQNCAQEDHGLILDKSREKIYIIFNDNVTRIDISGKSPKVVDTIRIPKKHDYNICPYDDQTAKVRPPKRMIIPKENEGEAATSLLPIMVSCPDPLTHPSGCQDFPTIVNLNLDTFTFESTIVTITQIDPTQHLIYGPYPITTTINNKYTTVQLESTSLNPNYITNIKAVDMTTGAVISGGYLDGANAAYECVSYNPATGLSYYCVQGDQFDTGYGMWEVSVAVQN